MGSNRRHAFTLVEMVVTMGILALVMGAMTSIMMFTAKAMPTSFDADVRTDNDERALREALWLFADAKGFLTRNAGEVAFKTPDLDYDGLDDTSQLTFSGTSGDPLMMGLNGTQQTLIDDVASVTFDVAVRERTTTAVSGTYETAEMLIDGWPGPMNALRECSITKSLAMRLHPQLPHDATQFRITRAQYFVRPVSGEKCNVRMSIADATGAGQPDPARVRTTASTTHTGLLSSGQWVSQAFASNTYWYAATERPFLWGDTTNMSAEFELGVETTAPHAGYTAYVYEADEPAAISQTAAMLFEVYAVVRRPATVTSTYNAATVLSVSVLRTDGVVIRASVPLRNQPAMP
jgi:prepilin-type N-terminal cleavage/methylation domain-containing protein